LCLHMHLSSLERIRRKKIRRIIGLMSGTSADGVSSVLVEVRGCWLETKLKMISFREYPYPKILREKIFELFDPETSNVEKICHMNFVLGHFFADCALKLMEESGYGRDEVDLIGSHGQTVYHIPDPRETCGFKTRSTLQLGELAVIAEKTGIATVGDFRKRDMAAGGKGAPLTAYMDFILHRHSRLNRVFQNIGGIANLTFIPAGASSRDILAFDTGPGNMIIDGLMEYYSNGKLHYDEDGKTAARGKVDKDLLERLLRDPYFSKNPPKATGREIFGKKYISEIIEYARSRDLPFEDVIATATAFTVDTIVIAYERFIMPSHAIHEVYVSGGGAKNRTIMQGLKERLKDVSVLEYSQLGIPSKAKEAVLIAILANEYLMENPSNMVRATGAHRNVVLGTFIPGNL